MGRECAQVGVYKLVYHNHRAAIWMEHRVWSIEYGVYGSIMIEYGAIWMAVRLIAASLWLSKDNNKAAGNLLASHSLVVVVARR